jgi:hypothetical protein
MRLWLLPGEIAVCQLRREQRVPEALLDARPFASVTRTPSELSIVCPAEVAPADARVDAGWRALEIVGPLDLRSVGIITTLADPLAEAGIAMFALSTFETDFVLVKASELQAAVAVLRTAGHEISPYDTEP